MATEPAGTGPSAEARDAGDRSPGARAVTPGGEARRAEARGAQPRGAEARERARTGKARNGKTRNGRARTAGARRHDEARTPPAATGASPADPAPGARRLLAGAARRSTGRAVLILLATTASAAATIALPAVLGHTLDLLLARRDGARPWVALCGVLLAAEVLLDALTAHATGVTNARSTAWLRNRGTAHLLSVGPRRAARFTPGDVVTRLTGNAAEAGTVPATAAASAASLLTPVGGIVALVLVDVWTAAVFLAGVPVLLLLLRVFVRSSSDSVTRYQRIQGDIAARLMEALGGARTVAAAGTARRERDRVLAPLPELDAQGRRMWQVYGRAVTQGGILVPLLTTAVLAVGGVRLAAGQLSIGELLAASRYAGLAAGIGAVVGQLSALVRGRAAARRTAELLSAPRVRHGTRRLPSGGPGRLELRGVTVVRGGARVLDGVDLTVPGGVTAAVVGRSGAGKSVLAAVAGRLEDPDGGTVLLDGVPLPELDRAELRREVGYAFERPALFGGTVGGAIAFGAGEPPEETVRSAARTARADSFIRLLPAGYATRLADAPLSGGELQRLGLARAFAHAGRLLVLDDATSSLDSVTELEVGRALTRDVRAGTRLLIAHRVSSAARADLVVWLENGRVRAVGPHEVLWERPAYRAVFAGTGTGTDADADADAEALEPPGPAVTGAPGPVPGDRGRTGGAP
ncbi:ABC transporter ATP-binding protein/permease [Streptomyces sp. WAC 00631]|uniref:ABC transporter ATP-binding protein n=1 Tax=Streptomyces sp. WAC 00631 TaxID=2203201 RepID=UPI000F7ABBA6|nr:ABC transporter ATP-binding protein [Streptomyces sp. WAC 00631]MCC5034767.1 ABC transporter ATP-binding protein/permease [Streptomyces sp. WAC 00631]